MKELLKRKPYLRLALLELVFGMLALAVFWPILKTGHSLWSVDVTYHWQRLNEITGDLTHGMLPQFNHFTGFRSVATATFYPWLTWLVLVPFKLLGVPPVIIVNGYVVAVMFVGFNVAYFAYHSYKRSRVQAFMFSLFYALTPIFTTLFEPQGEIAEMLSYLLAPLAFFGWLKIVHGRRSRMLVIGLSLMTFTHLMSALLMVLAVVMLTLCSLDYVKKLDIFRLAEAGFQFALVSAFQWLPIIVLGLSNRITTPRFKGHMDEYAYLVPTNSYQFMISTAYIWDAVALVAIVLSVWKWKKLTYYGKLFSVMAYSLMAFNFGYLPWGLMEKTPLRIMQFPFRVVFIAHLLLAFVLVTLLSRALQNQRWRKLAVVTAVLIVGASFGTALKKNLPSRYCHGVMNVSAKNPLGYQDSHRNDEVFIHGRINALIQYSAPVMTNRDFHAEQFNDVPLNMDYAVKGYQRGIHGKPHASSYDVRNGVMIKADRPLKHVMTPLMTYKQQSYRVCVNGKPTRHWRIKHGRIELPSVKQGETKVTFRTPTMWYRYVAMFLSLLGIIWLVIAEVMNRKGED